MGNAATRGKEGVSDDAQKPMIMRTLTSDPAVALELGRRLAINAQRQRRQGVCPGGTTKFPPGSRIARQTKLTTGNRPSFLRGRGAIMR